MTLDTPAFDGFDLGSTWNGFDNVSVTPSELEEDHGLLQVPIRQRIPGGGRRRP